MKNFISISLAVLLTITSFGCSTFGGGDESASRPPPPPPEQSSSNASTTTPTTTEQTAPSTTSSEQVDIDKLPKKKGYPYGIKTSTPGLVKSPYAPDKALVDVSRFQSGNFVRCPHTGKIFVVP